MNEKTIACFLQLEMKAFLKVQTQPYEIHFYKTLILTILTSLHI